jgi:hypothetical protein
MSPRHRTESRTSPRRIAAVEKQSQALELRKAGATYDSIAQTIGYSSRAGAALAVEAALRKTLQEPADELRKLDLERLNTMLLAIWARARQGSLDDIDMVLKILARKAKLLGLDAPVKQELVGRDGGPIEIAALLLTQKLQRLVNATDGLPALLEAQTNGAKSD